MEQRNDFIEREIQKLTLLLIKLISQVSGINIDNFEIELVQTSEVLKSKFDLSIREIIEINDNELIRKIDCLNETTIEKLAELLNEIVKKLSQKENENEVDRKKLARKAIVLIEYLDDKTNTFSITRMNLKNVLQHHI